MKKSTIKSENKITKEVVILINILPQSTCAYYIKNKDSMKEVDYNTNAPKTKAPRNKLGYLVLSVGVSQQVKFAPKIRVLNESELASIQKRHK